MSNTTTAAPQPMQGLADWLRQMASSMVPGDAYDAIARWAREVDAARSITSVTPPSEGLADTEPGFTPTSRQALAWVLWHHQGYSSKIGQAMRFALGMGGHDRMPDWMVGDAKKWAAIAEPLQAVQAGEQKITDTAQGSASWKPVHLAAPIAQPVRMLADEEMCAEWMRWNFPDDSAASLEFGRLDEPHRIRKAFEDGVKRGLTIGTPIAQVSDTVAKPTIRIRYERSGRCFWHMQCDAQRHAPPMKIERDDNDKKRTLMRCTACNRAGWYPHGSVGEVCCDVVSDTVALQVWFEQATKLADALAEAYLYSASSSGAAVYQEARLALHLHLSTPPTTGAEEGATTCAARDVLAERQRQSSAEGWTPEHDDEHRDGSLALAAACYAVLGTRVTDYRRIAYGASYDTKIVEFINGMWPWPSDSWKPKDRRSNLIRATALLLAEIEREDRAATPDDGSTVQGGSQ